MSKITYQVSETDSDEPSVAIEAFSAKAAAETFVSAYVVNEESTINVTVTDNDRALSYQYKVAAKCVWTYHAKRVN